MGTFLPTWLRGTLCACALLAGYATNAAAEPIKVGTIVVVMTDQAPLQKGTTVVSRTPRGLQFEVLRIEGEWLRIVTTYHGPPLELDDAWIHQKYVQPVDAVAELPQIAGRTLGQQATMYYQLSQKLIEAGRLRDAVFPFRKTVELAGQAFPNNDDHVNVTFNLGVHYERLARFEEAEAQYRASWKIDKDRGGQNIDYIYLLPIARTKYKAGDPVAALPIALKALEETQAVKGADSLETADCWNSLGAIYHRMAKDAEAEQAYLNALKLREAHLGDHPKTAETLTSLGGLYHAQHLQSKPEQLLLRALRILRQSYGEDDARNCGAMHNLAMFYTEVGEYQKAESLLRHAVQIRREKLGNDHPSLAETLSTLGSLYTRMERFRDAEQANLESLRIVESRANRDPDRVACIANNLGFLYYNMNRMDDAAKYFRKAIETWRAADFPENPHFAMAINNLSSALVMQHKYDQALPIQLESFALREKLLSEAHPDLAQSLHNLGMISAAAKDYDGAADYFDRSRRTIRRHVNQVLPGLSEKQQLAYLQSTDERFLHLALSLGCQQRDNPRLTELSAAWLLNAKGVTQEAVAQQAVLGRFAQTPEQQAVAAELKEARRQIAALTYHVPANADQAQQQKQRIQELQDQEQKLAGQLTGQAGSVLGLAPWLEVSELRKSLPPGSVFVQVGRLQLKDFANDTGLGEHYVAWLIFPEANSQVQVVDLGLADGIEKAAAAARDAIRSGAELINEQGEPQAEQVLQEKLNALARQVLHPLLPHIGEREHWLISPDSALWLVPWSAMPLPDGKYAVEEHSIRHLVSGRELVSQAEQATPRPPLMLANPNYDLAADARLAAQSGSTQRSITPDTAVRSAGLLPKVGPLPGTALEARAIAPYLKSFAASDPAILLQDKASEEAFKATHNPRLVVLSTHGFFLADQQIAAAQQQAGSSIEAINTDGLGDAAALTADGQPLENPLLRCGLLLAGCNDRTGPNNLDDGILTGLEIVGTDLRGTELVVLSACETGLGEVRNGNGVAGLRQAFQLAGARSVVATLWQIPDRETVQLMAGFFQHLADKDTKADSLRQAQLELIAKRRERYGAAHPYFWAAFTLTGQDQ